MRKILDICVACFICALLGVAIGYYMPSRETYVCGEAEHKMILNIGIAIGYLSSKQGIDEKVLYSEGLKLYNIVAKPKR